jgi:magnesium-transporting ATPase (P-type)
MRKFEVKMVLEFDSHRKRQSVVIFDGVNYKLYTKGADSSVLSNLDQSIEHPYLTETNEQLRKFSTLGYRTLVFAFKYLTQQEYIFYLKQYQKVMMSYQNRKEKMQEFCELVETNLVLLGMTAVEDSLQKDVKESI